LENAGKRRNQEEVGEGLHERHPAPAPIPCTSRKCARQRFAEGIPLRLRSVLVGKLDDAVGEWAG
jgi:hypothetical protein